MALVSENPGKQPWTFDASVNALLTMSLLIVTGARSGDLGLPSGTAKDEYDKRQATALQICEIDLRLNPGVALTPKCGSHCQYNMLQRQN